jgi:hypothetical protein
MVNNPTTVTNNKDSRKEGSPDKHFKRMIIKMMNKMKEYVYKK